MRTHTETVYSAEELREANPRGFETARNRYCQMVYDNPAWAGEYRDSLVAVLGLLRNAPRIDGPTRKDDVRRCMAWLESNVLDALRIPFAPFSTSKNRRKFARYGSEYRPGNVKPCPFTGFCADDSLLDFLQSLAREGRSPHEWERAVKDEADRLWDAEVEFQCSEDSFVDAATANGWEYTEDGRMV